MTLFLLSGAWEDNTNLHGVPFSKTVQSMVQVRGVSGLQERLANSLIKDFTEEEEFVTLERICRAYINRREM